MAACSISQQKKNIYIYIYTYIYTMVRFHSGHNCNHSGITISKMTFWWLFSVQKDQIKAEWMCSLIGCPFFQNSFVPPSYLSRQKLNYSLSMNSSEPFLIIGSSSQETLDIFLFITIFLSLSISEYGSCWGNFSGDRDWKITWIWRARLADLSVSVWYKGVACIVFRIASLTCTVQ
jgi:hypothetical protein